MLFLTFLACTEPAPLAPPDVDLDVALDTAEPLDTDVPDTDVPDTDVPDDEEEPQDTDVPVEDTGVPADTDLPAPGGPCALGPHASSFTFQVTHNGVSRTALVELPDSYDGTELLPTVLSFHGLLMNAGLQRSYTGLHDEANARDTIVVYPNGRFSTWNISPGSPDVGFVEALLDGLQTEICIDPDRTYSTGLSQGGYFSYMLGCQLPDRFAAIAPVAGLDANTSCNPASSAMHRVPLLHIHGDSDNIVPYGGSAFSGPSAAASVEAWASDVNDCNAAPVVSFDDGTVVCETRSCGPDEESTLCTIDGGEHTWPGAASIPLLLGSNNAMDANAVVLDFFEMY